MALVHNVLLRGLNSIYLQAPYILASDVPDFMTFCTCWSTVLHTHHTTEETVYFPLLESMATEKGVMQRNHEEHESFLKGFLAFDVYVSGVRDNGKEYDGGEVVRLIDAFGPALESHLRSEIGLLQSLEKDEGVDWGLMGKTMAGQSKKVSDRVKEVPFLITNSDVTYESGIHGPRFPPFPWAIGQLFRWVYIPQLKGAWRFSSCDDYGVPKELPFAPSEEEAKSGKNNVVSATTSKR